MDDRDELPDGFGRPSPTMVELLYDDDPLLDITAVAARAAERAGSPTSVIDGEQSVGVAFPAQPVPYAEGPVPMAVWILTAERARPVDWIETTLQQTWSWRDEAARIVPHAKGSLLVSDMLSGPLDRRLRLPLFHAVLAAAVEVTRPIAMLSINGERFLDPEDYLDELAEDPVAFHSTINVRFVTIEDEPGEGVMDTAGMAAFALPDVQLHFRGLEPGFVAGKLISVARYLFDHGDVIEDGHTVPGLDDGEHWRCQHEWSMLGPRRMVLDIDPGAYGPPGARS